MPRQPTAVPLDTMGFPEYLAVRAGHVLSMKRGTAKVLSTYPNEKTGRPMVQMVDRDGKVRAKPLARLILTAFGESRSRAWEPTHKNGDITDCRYSNLRWGRKAIPDRSRIVKMIRGLMARYDITPDDLASADGRAPRKRWPGSST